MQQVMEDIHGHSPDIVYLEFEKREVRAQFPNADAMMEHVKGMRKSGRCHVFLDEPQEMDGWVEACQSLRLSGDSVFVTGSNSVIM